MSTEHDIQQPQPVELTGVSFTLACPHCGCIMRVYPDPHNPADIIWECLNCDCEGE